MTVTIVPYAEANAVVDWRAVAVSMMRENDVLKATLKAAPHAWDCLWPYDLPSTDGSECTCWRSDAPNWMFSTECATL